MMNKKNILFNSLISFIIVFICLFLFIKNSQGHISIYNILSDIYNGWFYLLIASFLLILSVYIRALRWAYLLQNNSSIQIHILFSGQLFSYFINNIAPIRIGDLGKSYLVAKKTKTNTGYIFGSIIMERFLDILILLILSSITIWHYGIDYLNIELLSVFNLFYLLLAAISILLITYFLIKFLAIKIKNILYDVWEGFIAIHSSKKGIVIFYSFLIWLIYWCNIFLIQSIFSSFQLTYIDCLFILVISSLIQMIPTGFGALGVFHLGAESVLLKLGIVGYHNFLVMLWFYSYFIYTTLGAYYFIKNGEFTIKNLYSDLIDNN